LAAGVDGSIWVTICQEDRADYCTVPTLMRWDGQWASVPYPGVGLKGVSVAADGAFWALIAAGTSAEEEPVVARYADGSWTRFPQVAERDSVSPSPSAGVCGVDAEDSTLVCLDPAGRASKRALPVPGRVHIGPDGSLWVQDSGVVARLPGTAPD
jgi:streptogramin lyase